VAQGEVKRRAKAHAKREKKEFGNTNSKKLLSGGDRVGKLLPRAKDRRARKRGLATRREEKKGREIIFRSRFARKREGRQRKGGLNKFE